MAHPIVQVKEGKLKGEIRKSVNEYQFYSFKEIPFAKPPVGDLRFAEPVPPEQWEGVKDATRNTKFCPQLDPVTKTVLGDEDCLYLNVYTPILAPNKSGLLPVMVYFHGGGFVYGQGTREADHGPDYLIEKGVVVVNINYRLGVLGFLTLDRKEATGNMGLKDQVMALKWIQSNIAQFSGDPNNVTIFGISAGGASVEYLVLSPLARGLFHKAIAQAGSSLLPWAMNINIKDLAFNIPTKEGKMIPNEEELYAYLKGLPIDKLIKQSTEVIYSEKFKGGIYFGFVPTVEKPGDWKPFLSEPPLAMLKRGDFAKVPYIAGCCSREGLLMEFLGKASWEKLAKKKVFLDFLPFNIDDADKTVTEKRMHEVYLKNQEDCQDDDFAIDFFTDVDFLGGIHHAVATMAKHNSSVYFYQFSYDGGLNKIKKKVNINRPGACHGDDDGYIMKSDHCKASSATDTIVLDRMTEMWTNFAKYGNPTPLIDPKITTIWTPATATEVKYLSIDDKLTMRSNLQPERTKLFEELYEKYYLKCMP